MGTRRQSIKLPTDLVAEIQKIKDKKHRNMWRKHFKNDYAVKEMYEDFLEDAIQSTLPDNPSEFDREFYARKRKFIPKWESDLEDIKERISNYQKGLKDFLNGDQIDVHKYTLVFHR